MEAIHLIQKDKPDVPRPLPDVRGGNIFRSGNWTVGEDTARALVGKNIYFHRTQTAPSFYGGRIVDWEKHPNLKGRIIFIFEFDPICRKVKTSAEGWSQEMKIQR